MVSCLTVSIAEESIDSNVSGVVVCNESIPVESFERMVSVEKKYKYSEFGMFSAESEIVIPKNKIKKYVGYFIFKCKKYYFCNKSS